MRKLNQLVSVFVVTLVLVFFQNCEAPNHDESFQVSSSLESQARGVLATHCLRCHDSNAPESNRVVDILNTEKMEDDGFLVPGDLNSRIYTTIRVSMPQSSPLSVLPEEKEVIGSWILSLGEDLDPEPPPDDSGRTGSPEETRALAVLSAKCLGCHGVNPVNNNPLANITNITSLVENGFVTAGDADQSAIFGSVITQQMPPEGEGLSDVEIQSLRDWIEGM